MVGSRRSGDRYTAPSQEAHTRSNGYPASRDLSPTRVKVADLRPLGREARLHPTAQIRKLANSLDEWGFVLPIVIDGNGRVVAGWGLVLAARKLALPEIPAVTVTDLSESRLRALRLALNRLGEDAKWDPQALGLEFKEILDLDVDFDLGMTGFDAGEIDVSIGVDHEQVDDEADALPDDAPTAPPTSRVGDLWQLGRHRVLCADTTQALAFDRLLDGQKAQMIITDPPYNVQVSGHVSGLGKVKHAEFAEASGEMSDEEFDEFLRVSLGHMANHCINGAVAFVFMDWRHLPILDSAVSGLFSEQLNLCVWTKTNAGMGSLYRSQHELIAVYKKGTAAHINNVKLGQHGRYRTNVWSYPGLNSFGPKRDERLAMHPTVKPVALVKDAILDCSRRNGIVVDGFLGSGTTLIAAERTGRCCYGIEIEPRYVDVTLRQFRNLTGIEPDHVDTGATFAEMARARADETTAANPHLATKPTKGR